MTTTEELIQILEGDENEELLSNEHSNIDEEMTDQSAVLSKQEKDAMMQILMRAAMKYSLNGGAGTTTNNQGTMTDQGAALSKQEKEAMMKILMTVAMSSLNDGAGTTKDNLGTPNKPPKKRKTQTNPKVEKLKKKLADEKARLAKTREELKKTRLSEKLGKAKKRLSAEQLKITALSEKLNVSNEE